MRVRLCNAKVNAHPVQKIRFWQVNATCLEIAPHIELEAVGTGTKRRMINQQTIGVSTIGVEHELLQNLGGRPVGSQ